MAASASASPPEKRARLSDQNREVAENGRGVEDPVVSLFREFLRIPTVSRGEGYQKYYAQAVDFLVKQAVEIGLTYELFEVAPGNKVVVMTLEGSSPELKSILLNSHYDVVPATTAKWKFDPFSAHKDENGDIYARGTQDMKCVTLWHLEAVKQLKNSGHTFPRTIYLTIVPDEEIGGALGMASFIKTEKFKRMNVGFVLDEGMANPTEAMTVYFGERSPIWVVITCSGNPGHGSRFIENTAVEKVKKILNASLAFRAEQEKKLKSNPDLRLGDVTTLNITKLEGGVARNVVPDELKLCVDMRISPYDKQDAILHQVKEWVREAGDGCSIEFSQSNPKIPFTSTETSDKWWSAFSTACEKKGVQLVKEVFPASTDSRYIRMMGIPCLGFSPMNHTPILLHDNNEFLNERVFLAGIGIYQEAIAAVASVA